MFLASAPCKTLSTCLENVVEALNFCAHWGEEIKSWSHSTQGLHCYHGHNALSGETSPSSGNSYFRFAFSTWLLKSSLAFSLHSPLSKDINEANENWLEDSLRQLKRPLHPTPIPSNFHFYFKTRHFRDMGIQMENPPWIN